MKLRKHAEKPTYCNPSPSYPDGPPATALERCIARLDQESFEASIFAKVDDILAFSLFGSKRRPNGYRALSLTRAFLEKEPPISIVTALRICSLYNQLANQLSNNTWEIATRAAAQILKEFPDLFPEPSCLQAIRHLLARYHGMKEHQESLVALEKVQFHLEKNHKITCGLKAKSRIGAGTVIPTTSSSMSSDEVKRASVSTIQSSQRQLGPEGARIILGPFRFVNHDCSPNCQIMGIPNSHAFILCTIKDVEPGESITVNYSKDFSYFKNMECSCATCLPENPPIAPRRPVDPSKFQKDPQRKTSRRGGVKAKRRKLNRNGDYSRSGSPMEGR